MTLIGHLILNDIWFFSFSPSSCFYCSAWGKTSWSYRKTM